MVLELLTMWRYSLPLQASEDEGFVDTMTSSVESSSVPPHLSCDISVTLDDVWSQALHVKLNDHYTWDTVGRLKDFELDPFMIIHSASLSTAFSLCLSVLSKYLCKIYYP